MTSDTCFPATASEQRRIAEQRDESAARYLRPNRDARAHYLSIPGATWEDGTPVQLEVHWTYYDQIKAHIEHACAVRSAAVAEQGEAA